MSLIQLTPEHSNKLWSEVACGGNDGGYVKTFPTVSCFSFIQLEGIKVVHNSVVTVAMFYC